LATSAISGDCCRHWCSALVYRFTGLFGKQAWTDRAVIALILVFSFAIATTIKVDDKALTALNEITLIVVGFISGRLKLLVNCKIEKRPKTKRTIRLPAWKALTILKANNMRVLRELRTDQRASSFDSRYQHCRRDTLQLASSE
jgi:hypothetical protein